MAFANPPRSPFGKGGRKEVQSLPFPQRAVGRDWIGVCKSPLVPFWERGKERGAKPPFPKGRLGGIKLESLEIPLGSPLGKGGGKEVQSLPFPKGGLEGLDWRLQIPLGPLWERGRERGAKPPFPKGRCGRIELAFANLPRSPFGKEGGKEAEAEQASGSFQACSDRLWRTRHLGPGAGLI